MDIKRIAKEVSCPVATRDGKVNQEKQLVAIATADYGPVNESESSYWSRISKKLSVSEPEARRSLCGNCGVFDVSQSMRNCITSADSSLGYCRIYQFTCSSSRTCLSWVPDGPIT